MTRFDEKLRESLATDLINNSELFFQVEWSGLNNTSAPQPSINKTPLVQLIAAGIRKIWLSFAK